MISGSERVLVRLLVGVRPGACISLSGGSSDASVFPSPPSLVNQLCSCPKIKVLDLPIFTPLSDRLVSSIPSLQHDHSSSSREQH